MPLPLVWRAAMLGATCVTLLSAADVPAVSLPAPSATHLVVPLWPQGAPGSEARKDEPEKVVGNNVSNIHFPTLTVYLPAKDKATGTAVIVCPGGGHRNLVMQKEGYDIAQWLADRGVAAFVLKNRLARDDANPAGAPQPYTIERDAHPAFQGLIYPGQSQKIKPEKGAPPAFLCCGVDDRPDISEGVPAVYLLFKQAGVPVELHIYAGVGHGFGLRPGPAADWPDRFRDWLVNQKFIPAAAP